MLKIVKKVIFKKHENRMSSVESTEAAKSYFKENKSKNLKFLLHERFNWMNSFINENDTGLEVGSGAGFAKYFIKNKNFKLSDLSNDSHLDFKNIDAQNTKFESNSFDYVVASNMVHHVPYPIKFLKEMHRILKKGGKLIIFEPYCSLICQSASIIMKHEGFDFTVNVWDEVKPKSDESDRWAGNIAIPNLLFDDKSEFKKKLGDLFSIKYEAFSECLIFLNSGGVTSKTFYIPLPIFFLKMLNYIDKILIKFFPNVFCMGRKLVLEKLD